MDIDPGQKVYSIEHMRRLLDRAGYRLIGRTRHRSGSGKGWHVLVDIEPAASCPLEVVALQAILGSDRYREACNVARARIVPKLPRFWQERWNVLYDGSWHKRRKHA